LSSSDFFGGSFFLQDTHAVGLYVIHGLYLTETNALGITVTEIALKILSINGAKIHRTKRADRHAGTAANAYSVIHHHPAEILIPGNGLHGANDHAGSILTLLAGHGDIKPF
jgi:hypothetical protein